VTAADAPGAFPTSAAIVGVGLIGGSLAMRLREVGVHVTGIDRDPAVLDQAKARGVIDEGTTDLDAVADADVVIVATPLAQVVQTGVAAAQRMRPGAVLTDVGSVKASVVAAIDAGLPAGVRYVGGHPMAGNEKQGIGAADAALLDDRPFVLTPTERTDPGAVDLLRAMVVRLRMRPVILDPAQHDELVAQASHLPYLVSLALERSVGEDARTVAGPALVQMTRIARSPLALWDQICRANREAILRALMRFETELAAVRRDVEQMTPR
jgi:prephenate dehydrogenase